MMTELNESNEGGIGSPVEDQPESPEECGSPIKTQSTTEVGRDE